MEAEDIKAELTKARSGYFHKADKALEKIREQYGHGLEGFKRLLDRTPRHVHNTAADQRDKD